MTTRNALGYINPSNPNVKAVKARVESLNKESQSNGCLMRITPMAIWVHNLEDKELEKAVREETSLTHSNKNAQDACICYCLCIKYLLQNPGKRKEAFNKMK